MPDEVRAASAQSADGRRSSSALPFRKKTQERWSDLTRSERAVGRYMLSSMAAVGFATVRTVAAEAGTSERSVTRFVQKLGYSGFTELQREFQTEVEAQLSSPISRFRSAEGRTEDPIDAWMEQAALNITHLASIPRSDLARAGRMLARASGTTYIVGTGKASIPARYLWFGLNLLRPNCTFVGGSDLEIVDKLLDLRRSDLIVAFDFRRYPRATEGILASIRHVQPRLLVISDSSLSPMGMVASETLVVRTESPFHADDYVAVFGLVSLLIGLASRELPPGDVSRRLERYETVTSDASLFGADEDAQARHVSLQPGSKRQKSAAREATRRPRRGTEPSGSG